MIVNKLDGGSSREIELLKKLAIHGVCGGVDGEDTVLFVLLETIGFIVLKWKFLTNFFWNFIYTWYKIH